MNYTIATLIKDGLRLSIIKDGNRYAVIISSDHNSEVTHNHYNDIDEAFNAFTLVSETMIKSLYTEDLKRELLKVSKSLTSLKDFQTYIIINKL